MPTLMEGPTRIEAAGNKPKRIDEYLAVCLPAFSPETVHRDPALRGRSGVAGNEQGKVPPCRSRQPVTQCSEAQRNVSC
jgi:hypothetical protein